jgi:hypothetical protein
MAIIKTIQSSIDAFDGCDWTHEYRLDGKIIPGQYCEGGDDDCSYCAAVRASAEEAAFFAEQAMVAVSDGDIAEAARLIERAARIEREWGDDPAYRPALDALRALAE